ncbi:MAG TPA: sugar transferase [Thermoanaerobaculia bacterium]|nr:sugar transferase [Thermoanaerobaculia bacterium]
MLKQKARVIARIVFGVDLALTSIAFFTAFVIRDVVLPIADPSHFPTGLFPLSEYLKIYPLVLIIWSVLLFTYDSYHSHRTIPLTKEALTTVRVIVVGTVLLATLAYLLPLRQLSRAWFVLFGALNVVLLVAEKVLVRVIARWVRSKGLNYRTILIVGTGRRATDIARMVADHKYWGYKILGFVSDGHRLSNGWARYRIFGTVPDLRRILETGEIKEPIDEIVFAVTRKKLDEMKQIFILCEELGIRTRVAMNFFQNRVARLEIEELEGVPFLTFTTTPSNETHLALKRTLDVAISLLILALSGPIFLIAAIAIKLSSPGSVLFKQERIGLNGRMFTLYKFRTMIADAHARREEVEHLNEMTGPAFKSKADPRVTPVGRWLRRFSLDEIPQFWNVLKGDMSLVGPRPPIPEEVTQYHRWHRRRLSMKPGLTCLWQISGRNEIQDFDHWMQLDLQYIDNWSPSLDFKILLRTIPAVLTGKGAS